jgi:hypothetical protein
MYAVGCSTSMQLLNVHAMAARPADIQHACCVPRPLLRMGCVPCLCDQYQYPGFAEDLLGSAGMWETTISVDHVVHWKGVERHCHLSKACLHEICRSVCCRRVLEAYFGRLSDTDPVTIGFRSAEGEEGKCWTATKQPLKFKALRSRFFRFT